MDNADLVQRVYREFGTEPLDPDRQARLYVDLDDARGRMDAVSRLEKKIRLAEGRPTCQVLAGHRGSGKSTELLRLKKSLETGNGPLFVVYVQADDDIDRNDVDFPDILIAVVRQLAAQLKDREKGGQPTELMTLVREALIAHDDLPINSEALERARIEGRREYARLLREGHWPIIKQIRQRDSFVPNRQNEGAFRELLNCRAILQYVNGEEWYGLNPMVADLHPPDWEGLAQ